LQADRRFCYDLERRGWNTVYAIRKSIDIDFSHHIAGHAGNCVNLHGHTWKFEVGLASSALTPEGFVVDFKTLKQGVLAPCHDLLDHSLALGVTMFDTISQELEATGTALLATRIPIHGTTDTVPRNAVEVNGAFNCFPGGMKVAIFPFSPTSERLARWLYDLAVQVLENERVEVQFARVYETLHPVESVAEYQRKR